MPILAAVGTSSVSNAREVGANAYRDALGKLSGKTPSFGIIFSSSTFDQQEMLSGVKSVSGSTPIVGCSTAGEITTDGPLQEDSVVTMLFTSDGEIDFFPGIGTLINDGAQSAGGMAAHAVKDAANGKELKSVMLLADGLAGNGADIVRGVLEVMGANFPVVGGSAGDDFHFKKTHQYWNGEVRSGDVVGVGMGGNFVYGIGVRHGWNALGIPAKVTRASSNVLYEIDGKPAIAIYEKYFGERAKELKGGPLGQLAISYPLGLKIPDSEEFLIRAALAVNEDGSITCTAEMPEGADVRLMMGTVDSAVRMARRAAEDALKQLDGKTPKAILIFSGVARKRLMGPDAGLEIAAIQEVLGKDIPLVGFYTYGETAPIEGPLRSSEHCTTLFHNETVVVYVIAE